MIPFKRWLIIVISAVMLFSFTACGAVLTPKTPEDAGKLKIIATNFPLYDFCRAIGGEHVSVTMLIPPGSEAHTYEPTPQDIIAIQDCDAFFYIGGESDAWVEGLLSSMDQDFPAVALMGSELPLLTEETGEAVLSSEPEEDEEYDEHIWTSPLNAKLMIERITEVLSSCDPEHEENYFAACEKYTYQLDALDASFEEAVAAGAHDTIIFADRFPFLYFVREYGLNYYAAFPGCAAEAEPSAAVVSLLIEKVREEDVPAVFYIELSSRKMADLVSGEAGVKALQFHSCQNVTKDEFQNGVTYLSIMEQNLNNLKIALG